MRVEHPLHACQECRDPVPPHSTSPLTFCRPDSVTIVNTCCKGIMTLVSLLSWQIYEPGLIWHSIAIAVTVTSSIYRVTSLAYYWGQAIFSYVLISAPFQSHYGAVSRVSRKQTVAQRGNISGTGCCVLLSLSNWLTFEEISFWRLQPNRCLKKLTPWQGFLKHSRSNVMVRPKESWPSFHRVPVLLCLCFNLILFEATHLWWPSKQAAMSPVVLDEKHLDLNAYNQTKSSIPIKLKCNILSHT